MHGGDAGPGELIAEVEVDLVHDPACVGALADAQHLRGCDAQCNQGQYF